MSKPFRLGDYLKSEETAVPKLNTERIEYLPLDLIDPDPDNFYSLEGIADLAENIELVGLLDPIRVRPALSVGSADSSPSGGAKGRYVVVSGHRRRAACMMIRDGGSHMFDGGVACIVERGGTDDWNRLRLIFANSHTRVLSPAEISRQADEVLKLLTKLKASGVELPGRMREHVAEALNVSSSKLGRVQAIRRNLVSEFLKYYDAGTLNEAVAYRISQESRTVQLSLAIRLGPAVTNLTAARVDDCIAALAPKPATETMSEMDDATSSAAAAAPSPRVEGKEGGTDCHANAAALARNDGEEAAENDDRDGPPRASAPAGEKDYSREDEDDDFFEILSVAADHFFRYLGTVNDRSDGIDAIQRKCGREWHGFSAAGADVRCDPNGVVIKRNGEPQIRRPWGFVYDTLCVVALNRVCLQLDEKPAQPVEVSIFRGAWCTAHPAEPGRYLCLVDLDPERELDNGRLHEQKCDWDGSEWRVYGRSFTEIGRVLRWSVLPPQVETLSALEKLEGRDE